MHTVGFGATTAAISSVFLLALIGFVSVKRGILSHTSITEIARVLVDFIVPAALFYAMFTQYTPDKLPYLKLIGLVQVSMMLTGGILAAVFHRLVRLRSHRGTVIVLGSMQNNIFLPLPIAVAVLPPAESLQAQFFIGCFVLYFTPILWSVGVLLIRGGAFQGNEKSLATFAQAFNPPFIASISGLIMKMLFLRFGLSMPQWVLNCTQIAGTATTPLAMIVLGALLAEAHWVKDFEIRAIALVAIIQLFVLPALVLFAMFHWSPKDPVFAFVWMLQASSPPATNILLAAKRFGGNSSLVSLTIFVTYLLALLTIPVWLTTFGKLMHW